MKVLFCGLGSIGERYAKLIKQKFPDLNLYALRSSKDVALNKFGIEEIFSWEQVKEISPNIAFITCPTYMHIEVARKCAALDMNLFIEKPIGSDTEHLDNLLKTLKKKNLTAYVAYCLRFHPVIVELKRVLKGKEIFHANVRCTSYLPDWRKDKDHLAGYTAFREQGGGVILELSHEFDYSEYLFGKISLISGCAGIASKVTVNSEDWADALISHENGNVTNLHINFISKHSTRIIEVDTDLGFFRADLLKGSLDHNTADHDQHLKLPTNLDEMYVEQLRYFFENLDNRCLMNNLDEAAPLFKKIIDFRREVFN